MSQAPTDGINILDPWGFWKTARDSNLEAWSKFMIDVVNSNEYAQATGLALEQALSTSQPVRDAVERTMTQTLSALNMPSRAEVTVIAERLVNVEMRLDDLDAKLTAVQNSLQQTIKEAVHESNRAQEKGIKDLAAKLEALNTSHDAIKKIEKHLAELGTRLNTPKVSNGSTVKAEAAHAPERKAPVKTEVKPVQPAPKKEQEAK